jgi:uncharacterized membrane protein
MEHLFFARFPQQEGARRVLTELRADALHRKVLVDVVGSSLTESSQDMPRGLNNVPAAAMKGLFGGGIGGMIFGLFLGATGVAGTMGATVGFATMLGALAGTLGAVLIGAQDPDQNLERLAQKMGPGEVILSFHTPDLSLEEDVIQLVDRSGGTIVRRAGVTPIDDMPINAAHDKRVT